MMRGSRDGLTRSRSEYLPAPDLTEEAKPSAPAFIPTQPSLTPVVVETQRGLSTSPERYRFTSASTSFSSVPTARLRRSGTEPRIDRFREEARLPPLGSLNHSPRRVGKLPLPSLAVKIPYAPPTPSPLSGNSAENYLLEDPFHGRALRSTLSSRRRAPSYVQLGSDDASSENVRLPKPSLSQRPSNLCSTSVSRLMTVTGALRDEWQSGDNMVL